MAKVSIIIVCMNRPDNLCPCLDSIRQLTSTEHEILVVAYMFNKESLGKLKEAYPYVQFIESDEIRGFAENNNLALRRAAGEYCFVVNDDTVLKSPVIDDLVDDMRRLPENAAIVSPRIVFEDGSLQLCGRPSFSAWKFIKEQYHLYKEPSDDTAGKTPVFGSVYETSNITGAAFLIKTSVFAELGWFDERFFFTPEDLALSTSARRHGYSVYVDSGTTICHKWHATASGIISATKPSGTRGFLIFLSGGNKLKYAVLGTALLAAELVKLVKFALAPDSGEKKLLIAAHRNIIANIFTCRTTKEIFIRYYLRQNS